MQMATPPVTPPAMYPDKLSPSWNCLMTFPIYGDKIATRTIILSMVTTKPCGHVTPIESSWHRQLKFCSVFCGYCSK